MPSIAHNPSFNRFIWAVVVLVLCFAWPLYRLARFAVHEDLYSHVFLVPVICGYLVWSRRRSLPEDDEPRRSWAVCLWSMGFLLIVGYGLTVGSMVALTEADSLAWLILAFLLFFYGLCGWFWGWEAVRPIAFPLAFLVFMVPFPTLVRDAMVAFFQHASAPTAGAMLAMTGTSFVRDGLCFRLQGMMDFPINVAPECSGIHSSVVLLLAGLLASHLFLRTRWKQALLVAFVILLSIVRNGFRIFILLRLCVHHGPGMLDTTLHHQGGPLFFALSLVPFFLLLAILRRTDRKGPATKSELSGV